MYKVFCISLLTSRQMFVNITLPIWKPFVHFAQDLNLFLTNVTHFLLLQPSTVVRGNLGIKLVIFSAPKHSNCECLSQTDTVITKVSALATIFYRAVLEEALLCDKWQLENAVLSMCSLGCCLILASWICQSLHSQGAKFYNYPMNNSDNLSNL